jgi:hypothetical protein
MQNTKGGGKPMPSGNRDEMHRAIVADLASVVVHVRKSLNLIEQAVASEAAIEEAVADNVIVLDDSRPDTRGRMRHCGSVMPVSALPFACCRGR